MLTRPTTHPDPQKAQRVVAVVLDIHADIENLIREAAWIVRERGAVMKLCLRKAGWRQWLFGKPDVSRIERLTHRWHAELCWWQTDNELLAHLKSDNHGFPSELMLGPRRRLPWETGLTSSTINKLHALATQNASKVTDDLGRRRHYAQMWQDFEWRLDQKRPWFHEYILSAFAVSLAALAAKWIGDTIPSATLSTIFLAAVVYSAAAYGLAAALFTCIFGIGVFEFFFVEPRFAFTSASFSIGTFLQLLMFVVVALITSNLSSRLRSQARRAERQAIEARALFQLTRDIAVAEATNDIFSAIVRQSEYLFECDAILLAPHRLSEALSTRARSAVLQIAHPPTAKLSQEDMEFARSVFVAGMPSERNANDGVHDGLYFPLLTTDGPVAVLLLRNAATERSETEAFRRLVESLCRIGAIAVERTLRKQELENVRIVAQTEKLRSALLSSISHDFGTPLASIIGSATSLLSYGNTYPADVTNELLTTIMEEAERLNRFVKNVLQMNKLESGVLVPYMQWAEVGDLISTALDATYRRLQNHEVYVDVAEKLPLINADFVLMENVLVNLLDNATKYAPIDSAIQIVARRIDNDITIDVIDQGRGIPTDELGAVFDKFYRAKQRDHTVAGTGLGLAICKGIVEAHAGTVEAFSEGLGHGTTMRIRLPIRTPSEEELAEV
jgi:two-component system sensor histidine kinase KdpD